jgi:putative transposase
MASYEITLNEEQLSGLLTEDKGLQGLVETVLNQVLEAQVTEHIGAQPYERSTARKAYRNGYRLRTLTTRVGPLVLHVPQVRDGSFSPTLFARVVYLQPADNSPRLTRRLSQGLKVLDEWALMTSQQPSAPW